MQKGPVRFIFSTSHFTEMGKTFVPLCHSSFFLFLICHALWPQSQSSVNAFPTPDPSVLSLAYLSPFLQVSHCPIPMATSFLSSVLDLWYKHHKPLLAKAEIRTGFWKGHKVKRTMNLPGLRESRARSPWGPCLKSQPVRL